jgi:hypothetical protein
MNKIVIAAVAGLSLVSAAAYAQTQYPRAAEGQSIDRRDGAQHPPMHGMMRGGMMHSGMIHGGMGRDSSSHGGAGHNTGPSQGHAEPPKGDNGPSSLAFRGINAKMHQAMDIAFTGNADVDFVRGMIAHHEGALDMAKTVLAFGRDADVRKLAEAIVKAQEDEIALMRDWLKKAGL